MAIYLVISDRVVVYIIQNFRWHLRGAFLKEMDCGSVVSEFELESRNCIHFQINTLRKGMNPLVLPAMA